MTDHQAAWDMYAGHPGGTQDDLIAAGRRYGALKGTTFMAGDTIANAALFLNSELASTITGISLPVEAGPVVWTDSHGGFWVVTEYELIRKALRDPQTFTQEPVEGFKECGPLIPTPDEIVGMSTAPGLFFFVDGPKHDKPRTALGPHY